jgi:aminoglycoside phosphotransferase (APT) family kinase protein
LLQTDRAVFLDEESGLILKTYSDKRLLERDLQISAKAKEVGVPVPEVKGVERGEFTTLIMQYINGIPLSSNDINAAQEAGKYLKLFHSIGAKPPFSGGQSKWDEFILWWVHEETTRLRKLSVFTDQEIEKIEKEFDELRSQLVTRPIVLLHGDLQVAHILVDPEGNKVVAFIDFADAQPGDPLMDIAVLTLWDKKLTDLVLKGYGDIENTVETQKIISAYRLLRRMGEIAWLTERGFHDRAARNIEAVKEEFVR